MHFSTRSRVSPSIWPLVRVEESVDTFTFSCITTPYKKHDGEQGKCSPGTSYSLASRRVSESWSSLSAISFLVRGIFPHLRNGLFQILLDMKNGALDEGWAGDRTRKEIRYRDLVPLMASFPSNENITKKGTKKTESESKIHAQ